MHKHIPSKAKHLDVLWEPREKPVALSFEPDRHDGEGSPATHPWFQGMAGMGIMVADAWAVAAGVRRVGVRVAEKS
ncbi:hypothetical protein V6Z11_D03G183600 [Gossypium hirsutum]